MHGLPTCSSNVSRTGPAALLSGVTSSCARLRRQSVLEVLLAPKHYRAPAPASARASMLSLYWSMVRLAKLGSRPREGLTSLAKPSWRSAWGPSRAVSSGHMALIFRQSAGQKRLHRNLSCPSWPSQQHDVPSRPLHHAAIQLPVLAHCHKGLISIMLPLPYTQQVGRQVVWAACLQRCRQAKCLLHATSSMQLYCSSPADQHARQHRVCLPAILPHSRSHTKVISHQ